MPHFSTTIILCDPPRIYPSIPEYTPPPFKNYTTLPESTLPPRIYPPPLFQEVLYYATLSEYTPPSQNIPTFSTIFFVRPSQNLPLSPRIPPPLLTAIFVPPPSIYPSLPLCFSVLGASAIFSHLTCSSGKGGIFSD